MGKKWILFFLVAFMVIAVASACTTTRYASVKDTKGEPVKVVVKYGWFSNKFKSATVQGEEVQGGPEITVNENSPLDLSKSKIINLGPAPYIQVKTNPGNCVFCAFTGRKWIYWPADCSPCP